MSDNFHFEPLPSFPKGASGERPARDDGDYASWIQRVGGYLVDSIVVFVAATIIAAATGHHTIFNTFKIETVNGKSKLLPYGNKLEFYLIVQGVLLLVYSIGFLASAWQATLGMRLVGIHVARASDLGTVDLRRAAVRTIVVVGVTAILQLVIRVVAVIASLVDLLWPLWDARNQTVHDKIAGTVVLRGRPGA